MKKAINQSHNLMYGSRRNRCERCNEFLHPGREIHLELDTRTHTFTDEEVPIEYSQGYFTFGPRCAIKEKALHKKAQISGCRFGRDSDNG